MSGFLDAVKAFYGNFANFSGRSSRAQYWWVQLFMFIICFIPACFLGSADQGSGAWWFWYCVIGVWGLINLCPNLALSVRRMHDIGKGGGWIFISCVPLIGTIWFLVLTLTAGEPNANRFGPPATVYN